MVIHELKDKLEEIETLEETIKDNDQDMERYIEEIEEVELKCKNRGLEIVSRDNYIKKMKKEREDYEREMTVKTMAVIFVTNFLNHTIHQYGIMKHVRLIRWLIIEMFVICRYLCGIIITKNIFHEYYFLSFSMLFIFILLVSCYVVSSGYTRNIYKMEFKKEKKD